MRELLQLRAFDSRRPPPSIASARISRCVFSLPARYYFHVSYRVTPDVTPGIENTLHFILEFR